MKLTLLIWLLCQAPALGVDAFTVGDLHVAWLWVWLAAFVGDSLPGPIVANTDAQEVKALALRVTDLDHRLAALERNH